jgi:hypothetical protein
VNDCRHKSRTEVRSVAGEHVADLCLDCDLQLPARPELPPGEVPADAIVAREGNWLTCADCDGRVRWVVTVGGRVLCEVCAL